MESVKCPWQNWEVIEKIGEGSFGKVYRIRKTDKLGNAFEAAMKYMTIPQSPSDLQGYYVDGYDEATVTSIFKKHAADISREIVLMEKMKGVSNIVSYDECVEIEHENEVGWDFFIRMELLTPLMSLLRRQQMSEEEVVQLGVDICKALEVCAQYKVIHRDIKPENIFVSNHGDYKLGDFGIAKTIEKTTGGTKTGTYKFMSPEVYNNNPYNCTVDIYSLGLVLYWLLNERRMPFMPLPPEIPTTDQAADSQLRRFKGEALPPPCGGNNQLKKAILKACAFDPNERFGTATALRQALEESVGGTVSIFSIPRLLVPEPLQESAEPAPMPIDAMRGRDAHISDTPKEEKRHVAAKKVVRKSVNPVAPNKGKKRQRKLLIAGIAAVVCEIVALLLYIM